MWILEELAKIYSNILILLINRSTIHSLRVMNYLFIIK